jgi:acyl-CoA thioester hydrolase
MSHRPLPQARDAYPHFAAITTRWMDNDAYGHVNNVVYYSFFDTVVNRWLIERGALDIDRGEVIGLVIETHCNYFEPLAFPQPVEAGLRVAHIGSSVFLQGCLPAAGAAAQATLCMSRRSRRTPAARRPGATPLTQVSAPTRPRQRRRGPREPDLRAFLPAGAAQTVKDPAWPAGAVGTNTSPGGAC